MSDWAWLDNLQVTQHDVTSHIIDIDGDVAHCRAHVQSTHLSEGDRGDGIWIGWGNMTTVYVERMADGRSSTCASR
jgi:hypothetical protein